MASRRHLKNAPIKEAIIDVRTTHADHVSVNDLKKTPDELPAEYTIHEEIYMGSFGMHIDQGHGFSTGFEQSIIGYRHKTQDGIHIVQFRSNGFTFSRLEPYQTWEQITDQAKLLWDVYRGLARPLKVLRVATRYINVMRIPMPVANLDDYLRAPPAVPEELPQGVQSFLTRVVTQNTQLNSTAVVTQALDIAEQQHAPITLDIDVFVNQEYPPDSDEIWHCLDRLRDFKNDIFFESITEKTARLFA